METDEIIVLSDDSYEDCLCVDDTDSNDEDLVSVNDLASESSEGITFKCPRCVRMFSGSNGIISKDCNHFICKECIVDWYFKNQNFDMICDFTTSDTADVCGSAISELEILSVLDEVGMNQLDETIIPNYVSQHSPNEMNFCCGICCSDCPIGQGVKLKQCSHHVCKPCLQETIKKNIEPEICCPYAKSYARCEHFLTDSEIKSLVSYDDYKKFKQIAIKKAAEPNELFLLTMLDDQNYIQNLSAFDCPICFVPCDRSEGIRLRECLHEFCLECFTSTVTHSEDESVKCPFTDDNLAHCESFFQEREIRAVVSADIYNKFLEKKLTFAEHSIANTFHCKTVNCPGFGIIEAGDEEMFCPICKKKNCVQCKVIHQIQTCEEYQDSLTGGLKLTERFIDDLKNVGEVMNCPTCEALINKMDGCSWVQCRFCKTEICWATKGPRWGPKGKGDISGGCKCNINGKRCHPNCGNCH